MERRFIKLFFVFDLACQKWYRMSLKSCGVSFYIVDTDLTKKQSLNIVDDNDYKLYRISSCIYRTRLPYNEWCPCILHLQCTGGPMYTVLTPLL